MKTAEKFSTKVNRQVLLRLRDAAKQSNKKISVMVSEALAEYLDRMEVRPAFHEAFGEVLAEHKDLLRELAK